MPVSFPVRGGRRVTVRSVGRLDLSLRAFKSLIAEVSFPHASAHGYVRGRSTVSAATPHVGSSLVLSVDLKNFFGQIDFARVSPVLEASFDAQVCQWIEGVCFVSGSLPLGYRSSPALSNIAFASADLEIFNFAAKAGVEYTRWVDDLSFSGEGVGDGFLEGLQALLADEGWLVNARKTRFMRRAPYVLGLYVGRDATEPRLPRRIKQRLLLESYYFAKYGMSHFDRPYVLPPLTLFGYMSYAYSVEPRLATVLGERIVKGIGKSGGRLR
ncbi:reverse transcriptase family protein [Microbacterium oxydans]|uniref:reverse transcriptase family protein n=1 Tax=Microbacterium oxydans TaxID=82380 RepID=UPI0033B661E6